jgi:hypothetical protein
MSPFGLDGARSRRPLSGQAADGETGCGAQPADVSPPRRALGGLSGTARVTRGDEVMLVAGNQSTYIPIGAKHRLENPGKVPLYLIEVQSGGYLGEDDIVRFEDVYKRS